MTVIRSAGIRGLRSVVAELGGDADDLARRSGLPPEALDSDDLLVSDVAMAVLLETAAAELACPDLALRVARRQEIAMLGPLALAIRSSPTLGEALECTSRYLFVHSDVMRLTVEPDPRGARGVVALRLDMTAEGSYPVQGTDLTMAFVHRAALDLVGGPYGLRSVELPYDPPAGLAPYEELYGAPVHPGQPVARLRVVAGFAATPTVSGDEDTRRIALALLQRRGAAALTSTTALVHATLAQSIGTTRLEIGAVARLLALHPRTLQRRLAAEGTTFATVLDDVRRETARRLLTTTDLPMARVASALGLAEQAALTRAARRWWGSTPTQVRRAG
ncbi:AraC family transcriptional regulator [Lapillicoccus jejuensis]|uniref:Helix-turn-helix protein n=1 Tax=Lapillicoccus jejuensis TaxID=402171 RepID=A0A542DXS0_9MICO|nr:AraC family transcriptional regulator [Lapillicoccus jejuensis]TQJ07724.1 helix-turn-helix protein [Lapillicoccus jejuensis]